MSWCIANSQHTAQKVRERCHYALLKNWNIPNSGTLYSKALRNLQTIFENWDEIWLFAQMSEVEIINWRCLPCSVVTIKPFFVKHHTQLRNYWASGFNFLYNQEKCVNSKRHPFFWSKIFYRLPVIDFLSSNFTLSSVPNPEMREINTLRACPYFSL